jgi:hypothetical protein
MRYFYPYIERVCVLLQRFERFVDREKDRHENFMTWKKCELNGRESRRDKPEITSRW